MPYYTPYITKIENFQHGDYVTCTIDGYQTIDARISLHEDGSIHIVNNVCGYTNPDDNPKGIDMLGYRLRVFLHNRKEPYLQSSCKIEDLKQVDDVRDSYLHIKNVDVGDFIIDKVGNKSKVLVTTKYKLLMSDWNNFTEPMVWKTYFELSQYMLQGEYNHKWKIEKSK